MKAFVLDRYGKANALRMAAMPMPVPRDDEVLVEVHAASVNVLDSKIRSGEFKLILPYRLPQVMGHDLAGIVVQVGARVQRFKAGDEVYARAPDFAIGSFAESIAIKESALAHKPKHVGMEEAASIPLVGLTAWQALVETPRTCGRARRSSSRQAPAASVPLRSSWRSTSARPWRPPPVRRTWHG